MREIDARGLPCPQPVLLARQSVADGEPAVSVLTDNVDSAENVARFARGRGYVATVSGEGSEWRTIMTRAADPPPGPLPEAACPAANRAVAGGKVLLIPADTVGRGSDELGGILVRSLLNALAENDVLPERIVLLNTGVRLACLQDDTVAALNQLAGRGVTVLACGTCLKHFGLVDRLRAGRVSNAYEILNALLEGNVVSWG